MTKNSYYFRVLGGAEGKKKYRKKEKRGKKSFFFSSHIMFIHGIINPNIFYYLFFYVSNPVIKKKSFNFI